MQKVVLALLINRSLK